MPVADALDSDPHVVICGRVTDTGITLGPLVHEFGWGPEDFDLLAAGIVAGHIIECGAQATGGNFTDWKKVPSFLDLGFPIVECRRDGSFTVTKHPGSGGLVSCATVREQLLYEMGQPRSYLTPDVVADFSSIQLAPDGPDRVRVSGVQGRPPTDLLKVSIAYADGFKASGSLIVSGPDARAKADLFARVFWRAWCGAGLGRLPPGAHLHRVRWATTPPTGGLHPAHRASEILLRLSARSARREGLEVFRKLLPSMILSGPCRGGGHRRRPGHLRGGELLAGADAPAPSSCPRAGSWRSAAARPGAGPGATGPCPGPTPRARPPPLDASDPWPPFPGAGPEGPGAPHAHRPRPQRRQGRHRQHRPHRALRPVLRLAAGPHHRPARSRPGSAATAGAGWSATRCPGLWALNFLLEETLGGGGTVSLHLDAQGKTLAQALLRCRVEMPAALLATIGAENQPCPGELAPEGGQP